MIKIGFSMNMPVDTLFGKPFTIGARFIPDFDAMKLH